MRLKHLEASLSSLQREFRSPKVQLEQYPTSPHLAACVVQLAIDHDDLGVGRSCLDLGCGTGMLMIAAALMDTDFVVGVDCDEDALEMARENMERVEVESSIQLLQARIHTKRNEIQSKAPRHHRGKQDVKGGKGKGRTGGRGSQPALQTKAILIHDGNDGIPLHDNCVE